jgi:glycosyltransferase involved in cell wall biosynthesis
LSVLRYANLITLLARRSSGVETRVIINEQNLPSAEFALFGGGRIKRRFLRWLYPHADLVTTISRGIALELSDLGGIPPDRIRVIPNPVDIERVTSMGKVLPDHRWFREEQPIVVAVGRLHRQKGFDHLVRAFAQVRRAFPSKLVIVGEGPERHELELLIEELHLGDHVALPGFSLNPYAYMAHAAALVLSSVYEGFGNVLVEALALGVPIVSTRCPVGPEEILADGRTGILVPPGDPQALAEAMLRVLGDKEMQRRLASSGPHRAADYAQARIVEQYQSVIESLFTEAPPCAS